MRVAAKQHDSQERTTTQSGKKAEPAAAPKESTRQKPLVKVLFSFSRALLFSRWMSE
jgi:hypothetical protein